MYASGSTGAQLMAGSPGLTAQPPTFIPDSAGMGLFDGGILNFSSYGLTEWLIVGGAAFLAMGGMKMLKGKRGGALSGARRRLRIAQDQFALAKDSQ